MTEGCTNPVYETGSALGLERGRIPRKGTECRDDIGVNCGQCRPADGHFLDSTVVGYGSRDDGPAPEGIYTGGRIIAEARRKKPCFNFLDTPNGVPRSLQQAELWDTVSKPKVIKYWLERALDAHRVGVIGCAGDLLQRGIVEHLRARLGIGKTEQRGVHEVHSSGAPVEFSGSFFPVDNAILLDFPLHCAKFFFVSRE